MHFPLAPAAKLFCLTALLALAGCGDDSPAEETPPPVAVTVETVKAQSTGIVSELNGRLVAPRVAEVRARVAGVLNERTYREGTYVNKGDVLFRIDPAPFQADVDSAAAELEKAEANGYQARLEAERYAALVKTRAVSQQEYESANARALQAKADIAAANAALKRARLSLGYATVTAPISGQIGKALVTEGALVGQDNATPLAIIQQLDPIYADVTQSTKQLGELRRAVREGALQASNGQAAATLIQEDGTPYPLSGQLMFTDLTVDQTTGKVTLRSQFANPDGDLLPGSFVRVRLEQARNEQGVTVAQRAVQRDASGAANVFVVNGQSQIEVRSLQLGSVIDGRWVVNDGLAEGDRVVIHGLQHVRPGMTVDVRVGDDSPAATHAGAAN
jgi:membrane fusion protein (multidrug efflux system)